MKNFLYLFSFLITFSPALAQDVRPGCKTLEEIRGNEDCVVNANKSTIEPRLSGELLVAPSDIFSKMGTSSLIGDFPHIESTPSRPKCNSEGVCRSPNSPLNSENTDILKQLTDTVNNQGKLIDQEECSCLTQKFTAAYGSQLEEKKKSEREKVNKRILEAYSRKFLNDFSSNLEDATFFITKSAEMFMDENKAKQLQCNNSDLYDGMIKTVCDQNGIKDPAFIEKRKSFFLNSLSPDRADFSFEDRLLDLSEDIQGIHYSVPGKDSLSLFTRFEYDNGRIGLAHSNPEGKAIDHIVKTILTRPDLKRKLEKIQDSLPTGSTPVMGILALIEASKSDTSFMSQFDSAIVGDTFKNKDKLDGSFRFLMNAHPGFRTAMHEEAAFNGLKDNIKRDQSVLNVLETNHSILEPVLFARCNNLILEFANAVCTEDKDLVAKMNPKDLENLLHAEGNDKDLDEELHGLLTCEVPESDSKKGYFNSISKVYEEGSRKADYLERLLEKDYSKHKNLFSVTFLANKNKDFREKMTVAAEAGAKISKSLSVGGITGANVYAKAVIEGNAFSFGKPAMSREEAKRYIAESKKYDSVAAARKLADKKDRKNNNIIKPKVEAKEVASSDVTPVKVAETAAPKILSPVQKPTIMPSGAKSELTRELSRTNRPAEVERVVSNLDNKSADELNRLRNREVELLQRTYELESRRMEDMQRRVDELQTRTANAPAVVPPKIVAPENDSTREASSYQKNHTVIAPTVTQATERIATVSNQAATTFEEDISNGRGKAPQLEMDKKTKSLTVSDVTTNVSQEVPTDKINEVVNKLIEGPQSQLSSLEDIKANGIKLMINEKEVVVKFEKLDQRLKDLIELKFAKKDRDQQVSKLAVLRMLISQNTW